MSEIDPSGGPTGPGRRARAASKSLPGIRRQAERDEVRVGAMFGRSVSIFLRNYVVFTTMAAVLFLPWIAGYRLLRPTGGVEPAWLALAIEFAANTMLSAVLGSVVVYGVFAQLRGRRPAIDACISNGLVHIMPVIGVSVIVALLSGAFVAVFGALIVMGKATDTGAGATGLMLLGLMASIVIGLFFAIRFWVAVPVVVVEQTGVRAALRRSWQLTSGRMFKVFGVIFLSGLVGGVIGLAVAIPFGADTRELWAQPAVQVLLAGFGPVLAAVGYHDLRVSREGIDSAELAAVFD